MSKVGFGNERGLVDYLLQEVETLKNNSGSGESSTGAKKLIMGITQVGTAVPSLTLLENTSSLDFNTVNVFRQSEGQYGLSFSSTDSALTEKLFPNIGAPKRDAGPSSIELEDLTGKGGFIDVFIVTKDSLGLTNDNLLVNTVITIYESE